MSEADAQTTAHVTNEASGSRDVGGADATAVRWKARFLAARVSLPTWAAEAPERALFVSNVSGTFEVYAWDRGSGDQRQVTDRPEGTMRAALDPTGSGIWWFDDTSGDEFGIWRRQPFDGRPAEPVDPAAVHGLAPSYPSGLALGRSGTAVVGRSTDEGTSIHWCGPGALPHTLYAHVEDARVAALSWDESLVVIAHSEHGDSRHPALRAFGVRPDGTLGSQADLFDGEGKGLHAVGFPAVDGDARLLVLHERRGRPEPMVWNPLTGEEQEIVLDLPGEVGADWYPDGTALLVAHDHRGRTELHRYDLDAGTLTSLQTPAGLVAAASARPDGTVEYLWSSAAQPPAVRSSTGAVVLTPPGDPAPPSVPAEDLDVDGPGGRIHALLSRPEGVRAPYPAVFLAHGGPTYHDSDSFASDVAAWVDAGFAVVRVNYRGSDGYGSSWRDALTGRVGLTELEDIKAVRDHGVATGLLDPARLVLAGGSWGGYLTLLGLGTQPDAWTLGIAAVPVADYLAAYADEMEGLRAFDRAMFGGSPDEVGERYVESSPITYVQQVEAPVLILAGANDPRCPIRQVENYLARLAALGKEHEVYRFDAGHGSLVVAERIRHMEVELDFARRHLNGR